jgi:hypothetical protein
MFGQTEGNPYTPYTPESQVWETAQKNGRDAASWIFDGNTTRETYERFQKGIDEGDPEVLDSVRTPSLSGEYSDDYSEEQLMEDCGYVDHDGTDLRNALAEQYLLEVSTAFWHEIERMARHQLEDSNG